MVILQRGPMYTAYICIHIIALELGWSPVALVGWIALFLFCLSEPTQCVAHEEDMAPSCLVLESRSMT